ncbi:uncharacterized protein LOC114250356 [Bombyx mandarina]|uniref:Uncharacterized protein LOC114250356 n=1 Tax=Bombyx mandarina TaxID=7092 RepID=A0A6J2KCG7_BOMMA|nr:uncharacterized protein LOC114250356 [Bombyx mandarina]
MRVSMFDRLWFFGKNSGIHGLNRLFHDQNNTFASAEELLTNYLDAKLKYGLKTLAVSRFELLFSMVETENDSLLKYEYFEERGCRYSNEIPDGRLHVYSVYSYGACQLAYYTEELFERCGCVHPVRDKSYSNLYCNYTGLNCLSIYEAENNLNSRKYKLYQCAPSCVESEINVIHQSG